MVGNFFIVALRNILKKKFYSFINIFGLTIGITATLFIIIYLKDELSFDRFHDKIDRMYRVGFHARIGGQDIRSNATPPPLAAAIKNDMPEISQTIRLRRWRDVVFKYEDKSFTEQNIFLTDPDFFTFFSFKLLKGYPQTALKDPYSIVLTESSAKKFFGNEDPMGRILIFSNDNLAMKITGIAEDPPVNSHIRFNYLVSINRM